MNKPENLNTDKLYEANEKTTKKILELILSKFPEIKQHPEFDEEIFLQAIEELTKEFEQTPEQFKKILLLNRFFDAFYPKKSKDGERYLENSQLFEKTAILPMLSHLYPRTRNQKHEYSSNLAIIDPESLKFTLQTLLTTQIYGPSIIYNLPPNNYLSTKIERQDIVVSTGFSECRAIIGIDNLGNTVFSHLHPEVTEQEQIKIGQNLRETLTKKGGDSLNFFYCYPYDQKQEKEEEKFKNIASQINARPIRYDRVGYDASNPYGIDFTTIAITNSGLVLIGSIEKPYQIHAGLSGRKVELIQIEETMQQINL